MTRDNGVYPPSVNAGHPRIESFPNTWTRHRFGDLLVDAMRPVTMQPEAEYQLIVAKRNRNGIAPREVLPGRKIKTPSQYRLEAGDFVIAKRQIAHGACGFVPNSLAGAIVSSEYDVFRVRESLVLPQFFELCTHTPYFQQTCFHSSIGVTVEKLIFKTERWLGYEIPLPSLEGQRRVVAAFDKLAGVISDADKLIAARCAQREGLLGELFSTRGRLMNGPSAAERKRLEEVVAVDPESLGVNTPSDTLIRYIDLSSIVDGQIQMPAHSTRLADAPSRARRIVRRDDVLMSTVRPNLKGFAVVMCDGTDLVASTGFAVLRPESFPDAMYIKAFLLSSQFTQQVSGKLVGSNYPAINSKDVRAIRIPWPAQHVRRQVADAFVAIDHHVQLLAGFANRARTFKQGLMQKLFGGHLSIS